VMRVSGTDTSDPATAGSDTGVSPGLLRSVKIAQALVGTVVVWLVAWLAFQSAGARAAAIAAWLAAIYPPLAWMSAYVLSETLYSAIALGCVAMLLPVTRSQRSGQAADGSGYVRLAIAGALAGLAILTRPAMLFFVFLAVPWLWWRKGLAAAALVAMAAAIVVAPWTARNMAVHGRFVLVASEGGITFWTGNHPLASGDGDLAANPDIKRANLAFRAEHAGLNPEQLEPIYYRAALAWIASNPGAAVALMARKVFYTFAPVGPSYRLHSGRYFWTSVVAYLSVLPFAVAGLVGLIRQRRAPIALLVLALSSIVTGLVFFPQERFRIPVVDPALLVCAACWWSAFRAPAAGVVEVGR
jgi:4-amino-4-deoxy-L-arabinose transferase-like glycosyltransferase